MLNILIRHVYQLPVFSITNIFNASPILLNYHIYNHSISYYIHKRASRILKVNWDE